VSTDEGRTWISEDAEELGLLPLFQAASIQERVAQGPDACARLGRVAIHGTSGARFTPTLVRGRGRYCLHAAVHIPAADAKRIELRKDRK